ncbi:hypothetical protein [Kutzneria kofuensis]|uniref:hypothetical protein n=1 Tax=Kutzneria kofuensis TaxID=103725 RepID=UPI0031EDB080
MQRSIDFFGRQERVGFYSTFVAVGDVPGLSISSDPDTGEVHALRAPASPPPSSTPSPVLTEHGIDILAELLTGLL